MLNSLLDWLRSLDPTFAFLLLLPFIVVAAALLRDVVVVTAFGAVLAFWLVLSGHFKPFLVGAGVGCAIFVVWFARRMEIVDREGVPIDFWRAVFGYWPWLVKEIVKSAWVVTRIILHPKLPISPTLARFRPLQRTGMGLVVHANSITLTPGTMTVDVADGEFLVHALTREGASGLADSEMDRRVRRLEGES
jgi:multicomponent Na+:H+ antiporter subunit E